MGFAQVSPIRQPTKLLSGRTAGKTRFLSNYKVFNIEPSPQGDVLAFLVEPAFAGEGKCHRDASSAAGDPIASALFALKGVQAVFCQGDRVTVTKTEKADWSKLIDSVCKALERLPVDESIKSMPKAVRPMVPRTEDPFTTHPVDASKFKGQTWDRSLAKKNGFNKRSIKKVETWEKCFPAAGACDHHKFVISLLVQLDLAGLITNAYAEVHRVYITMMGEGKSEFMTDELFPSDLKAAEQMLEGILNTA